MKIDLNDKQTAALAQLFGTPIHVSGEGVKPALVITRSYDITFQHPVADASGESTQISINGRWLHRDGVWRDEPEPPTPRWVVKRPHDPIPYFLDYESRGGEDGMRWTERVEDAHWFYKAETAQEFIDTDEFLRGMGCAVEAVLTPSVK